MNHKLLIRVPAIVVMILLQVFAVSFAAAAAGPGKIVARGDDGLVVTEADLGSMRASAPGFIPTREALIEATVRTKLFAREVEGIRCAEAADKKGFARELVLSRCYLRQRLEQLQLLPGAMESYYRAHWRRFADADGKLKPLDDGTRRQIRARILRAKVKNFANLEYKRLCEKYHVVITEKAGSAR